MATFEAAFGSFGLFASLRCWSLSTEQEALNPEEADVFESVFAAALGSLIQTPPTTQRTRPAVAALDWCQAAALVDSGVTSIIGASCHLTKNFVWEADSS
jgi:hypothetical protein